MAHTPTTKAPAAAPAAKKPNTGAAPGTEAPKAKKEKKVRVPYPGLKDAAGNAVKLTAVYVLEKGQPLASPAK